MRLDTSKQRRIPAWFDTACSRNLFDREPATSARLVSLQKLAKVALWAPLSLLALSLAAPSYIQPLFVHGTYYLLWVLILCWIGTHLHAVRDVRREAVLAWVKENWPGLVVALAVTLVAGLAVHPALRVLSDEANLVGTSKNLFASKTATFTVSGKNYYDSYWDVDVAIDRRPTLFPFLISLIHAARGYSYENVFLLNLLLLPAFVLVSYRLAKALGGETFGVVASLLVVAHPITLISARSGGFDFITTLFALLVIKNALDCIEQPSPVRLAMLWTNLCMFAELRYETALFIAPVLGFLFLFRLLSCKLLRPFAFIYALTPAYLAPRIWQGILRGNVPEQEPGAITFSVENFWHNAREYFKPLFAPLDSYSSHSAVVIGLGIVGGGSWLRWIRGRALARSWGDARRKFAWFVGAWLLCQSAIVFSYVWGRAQYPSAARLFVPIDTFFSFAAAWVLGRTRAVVPVLLAAAVVLSQVPVASQHRMLNRLTQTRENATTWRFFEGLHEKRILIVTDHPNLYTIMDYGAMTFESANRDPYLATAFERRLFYDLYLIQQLKLSTKEPLPGYELWPARKRETVLEFQNDADVLIRISRLAHDDL